MYEGQRLKADSTPFEVSLDSSSSKHLFHRTRSDLIVQHGGWRPDRCILGPSEQRSTSRLKLGLICLRLAVVPLSYFTLHHNHPVSSRFLSVLPSVLQLSGIVVHFTSLNLRTRFTHRKTSGFRLPSQHEALSIFRSRSSFNFLGNVVPYDEWHMMLKR